VTTPPPAYSPIRLKNQNLSQNFLRQIPAIPGGLQSNESGTGMPEIEINFNEIRSNLMSSLANSRSNFENQNQPETHRINNNTPLAL